MSTVASPELFTPGFSLTGKVACVTGASRGIGRAIALALAQAGADVAVSCNTGGKLAEAVRDDIRQLGRRAEYYAHSLGDAAEVEKLRTEILKDFGQVDILVNNAGITRDKSFKKMTKEMWDEVINIDLTGVFLMTKQFIDGMADRNWGRIINISSMVAEIGAFGQVNYGAAKAAVIGFTRCLAREYGRRGVTVNAIAPGYVKTRMTEEVPAEVLDGIAKMTPVGRLGSPEEIAAGVVFLASPAASYVTGAVIDINGGFAM